MGWGISVGNRLKAVEAAKAFAPHNDANFFPDAIVIDGNTQLRFCAAGDRELNAVFVATTMIANAFGKENPQNASVIVFFDDKSKMPRLRKLVHQQRLNILSDEQQQKHREQGKIIVDKRAFKVGTQPYTQAILENAQTSLDIRKKWCWNRLLNSSNGKSLAFALLVKALKHSAQAVIRPEGFKMLVWYTGDTPYLFPNEQWDKTLVNNIVDNSFGEADERVTEAITAIQKFYPNPKILVKTIDTDMLIQILVAPIIQSGSIRIQFKNESVDALKWVAFYGNSVNERASKALLLTMASGCDYNNGLAPFGYLNKTLIAEAAKTNVTQCVDINHQNDTCKIDVNAFAAIVKNLPRQNKRKKPTDFTTELENAAFTIAYFSTIKRKKGGPEQCTADKIKQKSKLDRTSEFRAFLTCAEKAAPQITLEF